MQLVGAVASLLSLFFGGPWQATGFCGVMELELQFDSQCISLEKEQSHEYKGCEMG